MKKTDLEKNKGLKIMGQLKSTLPPSRFAGDAVPDRREQRKLDQAAGLVPFAVKLPQAQVDALRAKAQADGVAINDLVSSLLEKALKD
ncbi:Uncharacterised protein [Bordetella ansorpii]|uniref:Uncharacterized protein n=1 Tax=Bordetella ansorpii TaxID=288768 RepID=A0A157P9I2_9BORD|nr:hypothetical protein [Bordetella ansorpii]SAI30197.1 Uncharacterised protein [Bordetella ansorpii]